MSQRVSTDDILAAELARCEKVLLGLYRNVKTFRPNGKHFYFTVGYPTDADLLGFHSAGMRMIYLARKLEAQKDVNRVEESENTTHLIIELPEYQMTYGVHITFEERLRE